MSKFEMEPHNFNVLVLSVALVIVAAVFAVSDYISPPPPKTLADALIACAGNSDRRASHYCIELAKQVRP